ncbi:MAG: hypothetical protein QOI24_4125 [Acidobacteriota bacterium]|nr:hypothetical protein [Acidobacteriota bacterium]
MNFDIAVVAFPDGSVRNLNPTEFYAIPLGDRIQLLTGKRITFRRNSETISPMDALKKK